MTSGYVKWDKIYNEYPLKSLGWELGRARPILIEFVKKGLIKKGKMLDICCGAGTNSIYLAKNSFSVYAADISPKAIQYAKETARREKVKINLLLQSFINLSFANEIFDFVFDMGVSIMYKSQIELRLLKELDWFLKKMGFIC